VRMTRSLLLSVLYSPPDVQELSVYRRNSLDTSDSELIVETAEMAEFSGAYQPSDENSFYTRGTAFLRAHVPVKLFPL
jgi:hypothetical protein